MYEHFTSLNVLPGDELLHMCIMEPKAPIQFNLKIRENFSNWNQNTSKFSELGAFLFAWAVKNPHGRALFVSVNRKDLSPPVCCATCTVTDAFWSLAKRDYPLHRFQTWPNTENLLSFFHTAPWVYPTHLTVQWRKILNTSVFLLH